MNDYSLTTEIRARMFAIERAFITIAGEGPQGAIGAVDLVAMSEKLSKEAFQSYVEGSRHLRQLDRMEKLLLEKSEEKPVIQPGAAPPLPEN
jgi:hypothetical protein